MTDDRFTYVQALAGQLAKGVNEAFARVMQKSDKALPVSARALQLDEFAMACSALKEGFDILGQRATEAASELLDEASE